jgi:hypothetical protein
MENRQGSRSLFYTPKSFEEMKEIVDKFTAAIDLDSRMILITVVGMIQNFYKARSREIRIYQAWDNPNGVTYIVSRDDENEVELYRAEDPDDEVVLEKADFLTHFTRRV